MKINTQYTPYLANQYRKAIKKYQQNYIVNSNPVQKKHWIKNNFIYKFINKIFNLEKKYSETNHNIEKNKHHNFLEGSLLYLKNKVLIQKNGKIEELGINKDTFKTLFPKNCNQYAKQSKEIGDCWLISTINGFIDKPKGKMHIYNLFQELNKKLFLNFQDKFIEYHNTNIVKTSKNRVQSNKGIQFIEEAFGMSLACERPHIKAEEFNSKIGIDYALECLNGGYQAQAINMISSNLSPQIIKHTQINKQKQIIKKYANNNNYFIGITTLPNKQNPRQYYNNKLMPMHCFNIKGYDTKNKNIIIIDPLKPEKPIEISIKELNKYPFSMTFCEL